MNIISDFVKRIFHSCNKLCSNGRQSEHEPESKFIYRSWKTRETINTVCLYASFTRFFLSFKLIYFHSASNFDKLYFFVTTILFYFFGNLLFYFFFWCFNINIKYRTNNYSIEILTDNRHFFCFLIFILFSEIEIYTLLANIYIMYVCIIFFTDS